MKTLTHVGKMLIRPQQLVVGTLLLTAASAVVAQPAYPDKPIRLIIAFGAGGIADVVSRVYAQKLGEELGQNIIVENKPGAGGNIAAQFFSQAKPDGYTLFIGSVGTQIVNKMLFDKLSYDPDAFVPVSMLTSAPFMMAANKDTGIKNLKDLVSTAQSQPGKLNFGSAGVGTSPHLSIELLKYATKTDIAHVPYKSGAEAATAGMGGQVDIVADGIPVINPGVMSGKLQPLAVLAPTRNPLIPDVPTSVEQGFPDFQVASWSVLLAPPGTPRSVIDTLQAAVERTSPNPQVKQRFDEMGVALTPTGEKAYKAFLAKETDKWRTVIDAAGIKAE